MTNQGFLAFDRKNAAVLCHSLSNVIESMIIPNRHIVYMRIMSMEMKGDCVDKSKSNQRKDLEDNAKDQQLEQFRVDNDGTKMTTNQGLKVSNDEDSLKAGVRGPTIMEDFHLREKK